MAEQAADKRSGLLESIYLIFFEKFCGADNFRSV